jgi:hypothetical protein
LDKAGESGEIIMLEDFNAQVGFKADDTVMGRHGEDIVKETGDRLTDQSARNQLKIANEFFQRRNFHRFTWTPDTTTGVNYR